MTTPSYLTDLPNASTFGESFNYAVWTPNTQVELCNVPWNSDYRDIVDFDTQAALDAYLDSVAGPKFQISKMTLARAGDPVRINLPFNACYPFNYLRVKNGTSPINAKYVDPNGVTRTVTDTPKTLYYFIQDIQYLAPNTTQLNVMLDVWQTFGREVSFGNCYIERGHIGIANENAFDNQGRDYLTVPEALDLGPEYLVNQTYRFQLPDDKHGEDADSQAWVVIGIAADVTVDPGSVSDPHLSTTKFLAASDGMPNGFNILYFKSIDDFKWFVINFTDQPWITQTIMFISLIPPLGDANNFMQAFPVWDTSANATVVDKAYHNSTDHTPQIKRTIATGFRDKAMSYVPSRYQNLKKFLTSPFMWIELTTYNGAPLMLRPELMPGDDVEVNIYQHSVPPNPRWAIVPLHYNATTTTGNADDGEFLDIATFITNFPQFTVLNNNYLNYLAANRNSIHYQYTSADWSQQKALMGAQTAASNAQSGIVNNMNQADVQRQANNARTDLGNRNQLFQGASGVMAGIMSGNPATAIAEGTTSVVNTAIGISNANAQNTISNNAITGSTNSSNAYSAQVANRNYDFAMQAAQGDYHNSINAVQARVQDAKMIQPGSVGQLGGESFIASLFGPHVFDGSEKQVVEYDPSDSESATIGFFDKKNGPGWRIYAKIKQLDHNYMALIGEYWLRYGYAINRFGSVDKFKCMSKFTYWKLKETYVTSSSCPEVYKQTIRGIFEKGVTVWVTPSDIGNIDLATNQPLNGITL